MSIKLPAPLDVYFVSDNANDTSVIDRCFAANATVRDERKTIEGIAAIKAWRTDTREKYNHSAEPLAVSTDDGKVVVKSRVSGDFPGSPIVLEYVFGLEAGKITSLEIR